MIPEQGGVENNFNYNYLLVQTILKMRDAEADDNTKQYWVYFKTALKLVISHLDFQLKGEIEQDYAVLHAAFKKIESSNMNEASKLTWVNRIKNDFAGAHDFYIMQALNRVGVVKVEDEGIIDFESTDIDTFTRAVRDSSNSGAVGALNNPENQIKKPIVKPEMVLVTRGKDILQMPKADYDKYMESQVEIRELPEDLEPESDESEDPDESATENGGLADGIGDDAVKSDSCQPSSQDGRPCPSPPSNSAPSWKKKYKFE